MISRSCRLGTRRETTQVILITRWKGYTLILKPWEYPKKVQQKYHGKSEGQKSLKLKEGGCPEIALEQQMCARKMAPSVVLF
jgi:hypothetical protein